MENQAKLGGITIALHWIVACSILGLMSIGFYMSNAEAWGLYLWHKSIGVIVLPIVLARVVWRIWSGWPQATHVYPKAEQRLAKAVHWALLVCTVAMPLTGMLFSGAGGHGFGIFGLDIMRSNPNPQKPDDVIAYSEMWADIGENLHAVLGYTLAAALVSHLAGALKHHLLDQDGSLLRMLGKKSSHPHCSADGRA